MGAAGSGRAAQPSLPPILPERQKRFILTKASCACPACLRSLGLSSALKISSAPGTSCKLQCRQHVGGSGQIVEAELIL